MNNKGQVLASFVIMVPIILLLICFVIDVGSILYQKSKIISVTKTIIKTSIEKNEKDDIIMLYSKNNISYENIDITINEGINIKLKTNIQSIIFNQKYELNINITGRKKDNKIVFEKGD